MPTSSEVALLLTDFTSCLTSGANRMMPRSAPQRASAPLK